MNQRLGRNQRVRKRLVFQFLFEKGAFAKGKYLNLWAYQGKVVPSETPEPKIGIMVSRKVHKNAVQRNRWRRVVKETFRKQQHLLGEHLHLAVSVRPGQKMPGFQVLAEELLGLIQKALRVV